MFNMYKEKLLRELIAYEEFANMNKTDSDESFKVKKGVKSGVVYDPGLQRLSRLIVNVFPLFITRFTFVVFQTLVPFSLTSTVPDSEALLSGARLTFVLFIGLKLVMTWVCHFCPLLSTLINFAVKPVTFPLLTVKTQSPARTNFFASFIPAALLPLLIVSFGFWVTKTSKLIIPLAEKVCVFVGAVVIFPLVLLSTPPADGALI